MLFAHGSQQWNSADAAATTYAITCTDVGGGGTFKPKAIRFYCLGLGSSTDTTSTTTHERRSLGFAVGTTSRRCVATQDQDAAGTMTCTTAHFTDCVLATVTSTPARDGALDLNSLDSGGFTLIVDDAAPVNISVFWEAWGGSDITVATVGDITEPAATGNQDYTVAGFDTQGSGDQVVMFGGVQGTSADTTARNDSGFTMGFATSGAAANNVHICANNDDGSASADADCYCKSGECLSMITVAGGNPSARAQLTQFNTDGFRLNWIARATTNRRYIFMALKGGRWQAGNLIVDANTVGNTTTVSAIPFVPLGVCAFTHEAPESTAGISITNGVLSMGTASSPSSRRGMGDLCQNGTGSAEIELTIQYDEFLPFINGSGIYDIDFDAIDASSFRLIWDGTTANDGDHFVGYLTFGTASAFLAAKPLIIGQAVNRASTY